MMKSHSYGLSYLPIQVNELVQNNEHQMRVRELEHKVLHLHTWWFPSRLLNVFAT